MGAWRVRAFTSVSEGKRVGLGHSGVRVMVAAGLIAAAAAWAQDPVTEDRPKAAQTEGVAPGQSASPDQRAEALRTFLGLGARPDKEAAARGEPLFQQNCAFCHGPKARGATGPGLITADEVLGDDHGEHLVGFLKKGRPQKGMPGFATMTDEQLKDVAEFLHLQVEMVANRGAYHVLNIVVGDAARGKAYVAAHCAGCHSAETFAHIASRFRSPEQLQRGWIWPSRAQNPALAVTATVTTPEGARVAGRVMQVSDFQITVVDEAGQKHAVALERGAQVEMKDPLAAHEEMIKTLGNRDMHDVTAYLETLQ
ncbi:c-type cytochrome [Acidobacteria bacterium AB60]|nr:c-type cytochrome [Acidobacteria bacterium AB60]